MALFAYRAIDADGQTSSGNLDAANAIDLELRLRRLGLDLITFSGVQRSTAARTRNITRQELITFCFHLSQLLKAGVNIIEALTDLRDTVDNAGFRQVLASMVEDIEGGLKLSEAMANHSYCFDGVFVSLMRAGEQSGQMVEVLDELSENLKWQDEMASQAKKTLMYPLLVLVVITAVIFVLMIFLVPQLASTFKTLVTTLPKETQVLVFISDIFVKWWYLLLGLPTAAIVGLFIASKTNVRLQRFIDSAGLRIPVLGPVRQKIILARFSTYFAMLYRAGISVLDCIQICEKIVGNSLMEEGLQRVGRSISEGQGISQAFAATKLFPPLVLRMLRVGESTGALDTALMNVSYFYNREVRDSIGKMQTMLGPMTTVVLGGLIMAILYAIFLPIYDVISKIKFSAVRHFLYLTNTRLVSLLTSGRSIVSRREFAVSGAGAAAFERYLAQVATTPTRIFTDLSEEDLRLDTVPHVSAGDREQIVARKLAQIFRNTPYRYSQVQGRESEGRRDDRVIYTAITNPEMLRVWLEMLERLKVPLEGIHSAAVFSGVLLDELDLLFPHALLVTFTPGDAMRQTYFRDREIKFSRLTPIDLDEGQTLGGMIAEETTRTWQYLDSLRSFSTEDRLEVCVLVHKHDRATVESALRDFAQLQYHLLDIDEVAIKLGLKPPPLDSTAEEVMVHLFLLRKAPNHFATPEMRRYAVRRSARILLSQLSLAAIAASLVWGGWNLWGVYQASETDALVSQQVVALNRESDEILRSLPSFGVGGSTMRDAVTFYNGSLRRFPTITDFLVPVSEVLRAYPDVKLTQLVWEATNDIKDSPRMKAITPRDPPPVKSTSKGAVTVTPTGPARDSANPPFAGGRYEIGLLEATVRVPSSDFRGARAQVERLANDIGQIDGFRAEVADSPLDTSPTLVLSGHLQEKDSKTMESRFVLRIVRDHGAT